MWRGPNTSEWTRSRRPEAREEAFHVNGSCCLFQRRQPSQAEKDEEGVRVTPSMELLAIMRVNAVGRTWAKCRLRARRFLPLAMRSTSEHTCYIHTPATSRTTHLRLPQTNVHDIHTPAASRTTQSCLPHARHIMRHARTPARTQHTYNPHLPRRACPRMHTNTHHIARTLRTQTQHATYARAKM